MTTSQPEKKKPINPNVSFIDSRAATFDGAPVRIMAATILSTGQIKVDKLENWAEKVVPKDMTLVVTDTPQAFGHWGLSFTQENNMAEVLASYKMASAANLVKLSPNLERFNIDRIIQTLKVDERGAKLDIDSQMENGHLAILMAVWAARKAHGGYIVIPRNEPAARHNHNANDDDDDDANFGGMLPFTI